MVRSSWTPRLAPTLPGRLGVVNPRQSIGPDHLFPEERISTAPRIARFLGDDGSPRIGLVVGSSGGLPWRLLDLTARHGLSPSLLDFTAVGGFEVAERELEEHTSGEKALDLVTLEADELPRRLLSPVDIDAAQLDGGTRLVIGFGLTYRSHQEETSRLRPIVFPKPTVPTGAYTPVVSGREIDGDEPVGLLDYELELACVALRDIDLDALGQVDPGADFGYLVANDVSARAPILRSRRAGYALAKGRPTYLPAGPWVVPGEHFTRDDPTLRRMVLTVTEAEPYGAAAGVEERLTLRQDACLDDPILGIRELLELVSRRRALSMPGLDGRRWPISVERGGRRIIPAGSLLLTGTPGGTAIRAPGLADRMSLLLRSVSNLRWPSESYRQHLERHRRAFGFLSPGDRVSGWITGLGRQEWDVR